MVDLEVAWVHLILKVESVHLVLPEEDLVEDHSALMVCQCGNQKVSEQLIFNLIYLMISILSKSHLARADKVVEAIHLDLVEECSCDI